MEYHYAVVVQRVSQTYRTTVEALRKGGDLYTALPFHHTILIRCGRSEKDLKSEYCGTFATLQLANPLHCCGMGTFAGFSIGGSAAQIPPGKVVEDFLQRFHNASGVLQYIGVMSVDQVKGWYGEWLQRVYGYQEIARRPNYNYPNDGDRLIVVLCDPRRQHENFNIKEYDEWRETIIKKNSR